MRGTGYHEHNAIDFEHLPFLFKLGVDSPRWVQSMIPKFDCFALHVVVCAWYRQAWRRLAPLLDSRETANVSKAIVWLVRLHHVISFIHAACSLLLAHAMVVR